MAISMQPRCMGPWNTWTTIRSIPSSMNCEGILLVGIPNHPNWLIFAREPYLTNDFPRVIIYVNIRLSSL